MKPNTIRANDATKSECGTVRELMSADAARALTDAQAAIVEAHVARCARCVELIAGKSGGDAEIERLLALPRSASPTGAEWARIAARLAAEPLPRERAESAGPAASARGALRRRRSPPLVALAAALLLSLVVFEIFRDGGGEGGTGTLPAVHTAFASDVEVLEVPDGTTCMIVTPATEGEAVLVLFAAG